MHTGQHETGPYGIFGLTPELRHGDNFLEDYTLAFELAQSLEIPASDETGEVIRNAVSESLGEEASSFRVLAVSYLTSEAKDRALRRPLCRDEKELKQLRHERLKFWPPISIQRIKKEHTLLKEQISINQQQQACIKASTMFLKEAVTIIEMGHSSDMK